MKNQAKKSWKRTAAMAAAMFLFGGLPTWAQNTLQFSMTGRVLTAYDLKAVAAIADSNHEVSVQSQGRERVLIQVDRSSLDSTPGGVIRVVLALRTNASSYQLRAVQVSGPGPVEVDLGVPQASGSLVAAGAVTQFAPATESLLGDQEQVLAVGSRISMRGSFTSPNNALLVPVDLRVDPKAPSGSYQILLVLGS